jgi:hypothetical protein
MDLGQNLPMKRDDRKRPTESSTERLRRWVRRSNISIIEVLADHGYLISTSYANQLLSGETLPGKNFIQAFFESTGVRLSSRFT